VSFGLLLVVRSAPENDRRAPQANSGAITIGTFDPSYGASTKAKECNMYFVDKMD
jgi:hypothetical protein